MLRKIWENLKAAAIVILITLAVFVSYFLVIFGVIALLMVGLFLLIRALNGYHNDEEYDDSDINH